MAIRNSPMSKSPEYEALLNKVRKILIEGQMRIEQERVRTYWETGKVIHVHILKYERADYGKEVIKNLADDLKVNKTTLNRCVKFARTYPALPIGDRGHQFSWSHYRGLMTIPGDTRRILIEKAAAKNNWSAEELRVRIKEERGETAETGLKPVSPKNIPADNKPLTPLRGELYTYKLVERPNLSPGIASSLLVDLGFGIFHEPESRLSSGFGKDQIVESKLKDDAYKFSKTDRTAKDLFTYAAYVEKVIDGDTIKVRMDLGFHVWVRHTLRLRGLDCPEVSTPAGGEARTFVRSLLKESKMIIVRSSVSDKYDRYLADIFIPQGAEPNFETDVYLNNLLLETGRAVRM